MPSCEKTVSSVHCIKIKKKDSTPDFTLKVSWSDNSTHERTRNYNDITDFLRILTKITPNSVDLPVLKDAHKFVKNGILKGEKKKNYLDQFFQSLLSTLPNDILSDDRFISFFDISSTNELKAKYSKILETVQGDIIDHGSIQMISKDNIEEYSSLKLNPANCNPSPIPENYQYHEDFVRKQEINSTKTGFTNCMASAIVADRNVHNKRVDDYWVVKDFLKRRNDEINVESGVSVTVLEKKPNGLYLVLNKETLEKGLIPKEILLPQKENICYETVDDMEFIAVGSHEAINSDEITIHKGDLIRLLSSPSTGWWKIKIGEKEGKVPGFCIGVPGSKPIFPSLNIDQENYQNKLHTCENIEQLYSRVEKIRHEKNFAGNNSKSNMKSLPSYENLPKHIDKHVTAVRKANSLSRDIKDDQKLIGKVRPKDRLPSYDGQRISYVNCPSGINKRISNTSIYSNVETINSYNYNRNSDLLYDNIDGVVGTITKCKNNSLTGIESKRSSNSSQSSSEIATQFKMITNDFKSSQSSVHQPCNKNYKPEVSSKPNPPIKNPLKQTPHSTRPSIPCAKPPLQNKPKATPRTFPRPDDASKPTLPHKPRDRTPIVNAGNKANNLDKTPMYRVYEINKIKAEELLNLGIKGTFLFRSANKDSEAAILSIYDGSKMRHLSVERDEDGELTIGNCNFNSLKEIVEYYKLNPISRNANGDQLKLTKHLHVHDI